MGLEPITSAPKADTLPITPCSSLWSESDLNRQSYVCKTYAITNYAITPFYERSMA